MENNRKAVARILLKLGAVSVSPLKPFTWASGLRSPLYCDNRLLVSTVSERRTVIQAFVDLINENDWRPDVIAGTATAGIPHAAWIAEAMSLPMVYVRSSEKKHGRRNRIEGRLNDGQEVVVIEDLISTGGSVINAAQCLVESGAKVKGVAAIFRYGLDRATKAFEESGFAYDTLTDLDALLDVAVIESLISDEERELVNKWRPDPAGWSETYG